MQYTHTVFKVFGIIRNRRLVACGCSPVAVINNDSVRSGKVDTEASGSSGQQKHTELLLPVVEGVDPLLPLL